MMRSIVDKMLTTLFFANVLTTMRGVWRSLFLAVVCATTPMAFAETEGPTTSDQEKGVLARPEIQALIAELSKEQGFDKTELRRIFAESKILPDVMERINKPAEAMPWHRYKTMLIQPKRIDQGADFWQENKTTLDRAQKAFGVPASVIAGILAVETRFGRVTGNFRIIDSLTTLALEFPRRSAFFRKELVQFLLLCREEGFDPLTLKGSYAGAMGKPQFMPSSYRSYAIDFSGDGKRDLFGNTDDAIGSIANYLSRFGWIENGSVALPVTVSGDNVPMLLGKGIKPQVSLAELRALGVVDSGRQDNSEKAAVLAFENQSGTEYWLGLTNFYAITRYNQSQLYAMAVYQLGEAICAEFNRRSKIDWTWDD